MAIFRPLAAAIVALGLLGAAPAPLDLVKIDSGSLMGATHRDVVSFKGIPFAKPPIGELRWHPPQPVAPWTGVRAAVDYGHDCMQTPFPDDSAPLRTQPSEDCLVLNLWRPAKHAPGKLPVMVWIYGGGYVNGGTSPAIYDGSAFARHGVILVSFNYRLGRFGFFAHPALSKQFPNELQGNYAYMDQIAALQWVKRNIAAFGGDPDNVTVFGESAGGFAVHMLMTSPLTQGLFHKAIIESGGGRTIEPARRLHEDLPSGLVSGEKIGLAFAKSVGIEGEGPEALAALRRVPAARVDNGLNIATADAQQDTYAEPMIDGRIVVEPAEAVYRAGRMARVPVMVGATNADLGFNAAKTIDELFAPFGADRGAAVATYDPDLTNDVQAVGFRVAADRLMVEPARFIAGAVAANGQSAYHFRFSYVAKAMRSQWGNGAPHASEIPFVFDTVAVKYGAELGSEDETVAKLANGYWANFAKTGDPNGVGLPPWPKYDQAGRILLEFSQGGARAGADPLKNRLDLTAKVAGN